MVAAQGRKEFYQHQLLLVLLPPQLVRFPPKRLCFAASAGGMDSQEDGPAMPAAALLDIGRRHSILTEGRVFFGVNVFTALRASKKFQGEFLVCCIVPNYACLRLFTFVYVFLHIIHNVRQHCDVQLMVPSCLGRARVRGVRARPTTRVQGQFDSVTKRFGVSVCFVMTTVNVDSDAYTSLTRRS
jgi:hypothetical protein